MSHELSRKCYNIKVNLRVWEDNLQQIKLNNVNLLMPEKAEAIVIMICGIFEDYNRYESVVRKLNDEGYGVAQFNYSKRTADNKLTISNKNDLTNQLIELHHELKSKYPELKQNVLTHEFGGIIIRNIIQQEVNFNKLILTNPISKHQSQIKLEHFFVNLINKWGKKEGVSKIYNHLYHIKNRNYARLKFYSNNWLNSNIKEYEQIKNTQYYHFPLTNYYAKTIIELIKRAHTPENRAELKSNDYLILIGGDDPVANLGREKKRFNPLRVKVYPKLRHDLFFEAGSDVVINDVLTFLRT